MEQRLGLVWAVCLAYLSMAGSGCRTPAPDAPEAASRILTHTRGEAFRATVSALKAMHFKIDKADPDTGFIQTQPLSGAQWFEVWRRDNAGGYAFAEANLHSLRRTVTVHISDQTEQARIECRVECERLSVPSRQVTSSSQLYRILSNSETMMQRLEFSDAQEQSREWIPLGPDPALQDRILARIERGLQAAPAGEPSV